MELLSSSPPPALRGDGDAADRISALPDDMLILVLARLGCPRAAARTGVLSRRWRGLWTHIPPVSLRLRDVELEDLQGAVARAACAGMHRIDVLLPEGDWEDESHEYHEAVVDAANSVLVAAAGLSPVEFLLTIPSYVLPSVGFRASLPSFRRATSIELKAEEENFEIDLPRNGFGGEFSALDQLSISGCIIDLAALIPRCPRLRVLRAAELRSESDDITIHSASLEVITVVNYSGAADRVDIVCPALKQLMLRVRTYLPEVSSLTAPLLDNCVWMCENWEAGDRSGVGPWELDALSIRSHGHGCASTLSVAISAAHRTTTRLLESSLEEEIHKLPVIDFSHLEIHVCNTLLHDYGPIVLHLLGTAQIRATAIQSLKVLLSWYLSNEGCPTNCTCAEPNNFTAQTASLSDLEQVEIEGLQGADHEYDFVELIFRCAPLLKRLSLNFCDDVTPSDHGYKKIRSIAMDYPEVDCKIIVPIQNNEVCPTNWTCAEPNNFTSQTASLSDLEQVDIEGLQGADREYDCVELIFRCAPLLKRLSLKFFDNITPSDHWYKKIRSIAMEYPEVDCKIIVTIQIEMENMKAELKEQKRLNEMMMQQNEMMIQRQHQLEELILPPLPLFI